MNTDTTLPLGAPARLFSAAGLQTHVKCICQFWRPSLSRRITLYFLAFGLIIFLVTSSLYVVAARKGFLSSTGKIIQHQVSRLQNSSEPDFIWKGIGKPQPDLHRLFDVIENLTSSFYRTSDPAIYARISGTNVWYRLAFGNDPILKSELHKDPSVRKLESWLGRPFHLSAVNLVETGDTLSMFADITGPSDLNRYFLRIDLGIEGIARFVHRQMAQFLIFLAVVVLVSRLLAYFFTRRIARPIENLSAITAQVARGDLSRKIPVASNDEIGQLTQNFNTMIDGLREWERIRVIEFELEKGRQIQREFLPRTIPRLPEWEIAACFQPAGQVSGDFYDVFELPDGCLGLVIADVCDKGVGSALYMALFRSLIRVFAEQATHCAPEIVRPGQLCVAPTSEIHPEDDQWSRLHAVPLTNNYIARIHGNEGMFATLFFGILNPATGRLTYINGGHEPPIIMDGKGLKDTLRPTGPAVGMMPDMAFGVRQVQLHPGEIFLGYTDGVTEACSPAGDPFTRKRLQTLFAPPRGSVSDLLNRIQTGLSTFIDTAPRHDDVTMLAVQRAPVRA